jgi:hypothetical protein
MTQAVQAITTALSPQDNPIIQAEFRYQCFVIQRSRAGWFWILLAVLMVVPALILSLVYSVVGVLGLGQVENFFTFPQTIHAPAAVLLVLVNLSLYPVVLLVNVSLAANSIRREKVNHTWGLLQLTRIRPMQIVLGKWVASLRALNGDYVMVMIVRVGLVAMYTTILLPSYLWTLDGITVPYRLYFIGLVPLLLLHAWVDYALTAAFGVVAAIPDEAWGTVPASAMFLLRLFMVVGTGVWLAWVLWALTWNAVAAFAWAVAGILLYALALAVTLVAATVLMRRT